MAIDFLVAAANSVTLKAGGIIDNSGPFSVAMWVNPGIVIGSWWYNETKTDDDDPNYSLGGGGASATLRFFARNTDGTGEIDLNTVATYATGVWSHICITRSGTTFLLYINGTSESFSATLPTSVTINKASLALRDRITDAYNTGQLEDVRVFNRLLAPKEVKALAAGYRGPLGGEVGWWTCNDFQGIAHPDGTTLAGANILPDMGSGGNNGTPAFVVTGPIARASEAPRMGLLPFFAGISGLISITLTGAISTITGTQTEDITKVLSGSVSTITGALTKSITKILSGAISSITGTFSVSDYITKIWGFIKTIIAPASAVRGVTAPTTDVEGETAPKAGVKEES